MKSRFVIWTLSLILAIASVPMTLQAADAPKAAPAKATQAGAPAKATPAKVANAIPVEVAKTVAIPAVPATGTVEVYKEYIQTVSKQLQEAMQGLATKVQTEGINPQSDEFVQTAKTTLLPYFNHLLEAVDKALVLKDISDDDFAGLAQGKLQMLMIFQQIDSTFDLNKKLAEFSAQLRQMKKDELADALDEQLFQGKVKVAVETGDAEGFGKLADEVFAQADKAGKGITVALANHVAMIIMASGSVEGYKLDAAKSDKYFALLSQATAPEVQKIASQLEEQLFQSKVMKAAQTGDAETFGKLVNEVLVKADKAGKDITANQAKQVAMLLLIGKEVKGYKADETLMPKYLKQFSEANDAEVKQIAIALQMELIRAEGEKRFQDALGNEFKFSGKFMDGTEYKAADYAGKVVLIDYWATWCGPCCGELPNVKKLYKAYHEKGFEVIGVSCDDPEKIDDFKAFLEKNEIPWKQMFDKDAVVPGEKMPDGKPLTVSTYYAISGIPCPVLIGKDGKVLSLNARGDELKAQLVKIFGEVKMDDGATEAKANDKKPEAKKPEVKKAPATADKK